MKTAIPFSKYQGAGNDFIMLNAVKQQLPKLSQRKINMLCDRHLGIGADGLIVIHKVHKRDFHISYYNADGKLGTFCGNGARASVLFALDQKIIKKHQTLFSAADGDHNATIRITKNKRLVSVSMSDVNQIEKVNNQLFFLDTGSPHLVKRVNNIQQVDVIRSGSKLRHHPKFEKTGGVNVNFYSLIDNTIYIRTYERGVENETLACGTGITATAIVANYTSTKKQYKVKVIANDISLKVTFQKDELNRINNIQLTGPASLVFTGKISI